MRKSFADSLTGVKSLFLFMVAFAVMFGGGSAFAQNMSFVNVNVPYYNDGVQNATKIAAPAVLVGDDTVTSGGGSIFGTGKDGDVPKSDAGDALQDLIGISKPIIANIQSSDGVQSGEPFALMAVITGVTEQLVSDVKASNATAIAQAIALASATFDSSLFASTVNSGSITAVSPTNVYTIGADVQGLPVVANATNVLVLAWKNVGVLTASNPDSGVADDDLKAAVSIVDGGTKVDSNFVGLETADSGPTISSTGNSQKDQFGNNRTVLVRNSTLIFENSDNNSTAVFTATIPTPTTTEFRTLDTLTIQAQITTNASLDGEPNVYFGSLGDAIVLDASSGNGTGKDANGSTASFTTTVVAGGAAIDSASDTKSDPQDDVQYSVSSANVPAGDAVVSLTGTVRTDTLTSGANSKLSLVFSVNDEIGSASSATNNSLYLIDTVAPTLFNVSVKTEGDLGKNTQSGLFGAGKIGFENAAHDQVELFANVHPEGESTLVGNDINWLEMQVGPFQGFSALQASKLWSSEATRESGANEVGFASSAQAVQSFPDTFNFVDMASVSADFSNNIDGRNATNAGFIVYVSDNARNMAKDVSGATKFVTTNSFTFERSSAQKTISAATFTVDNVAPVVQRATFTAYALPSDFYTAPNGETRTTAEKSALFELLQSVSDTVNAATNLALATTSHLVTEIAPGDFDSGNKGMPVQITVEFQPTSDTTADFDGSLSAVEGTGTSVFSSLFIGSTTSYNDSIASGLFPNVIIDEATGSSVWSLQSAAFGKAGSNLATAIFRLVDGITTSGAFDTSAIAEGLTDASLTAMISDKLHNYVTPADVIGLNAHTNPFIIDASGPEIFGVTKTGAASGNVNSIEIGTLRDGSGAARADTIVLITKTENDQAIPAASQLTSHVSLELSSDNNSFLNSTNAIGTVPAEATAGNTIIISATFRENQADNAAYRYIDNDFIGNAGATDKFVYFPYVFHTGDAGDLTNSDDIIVPGNSNKDIGGDFGAIVADFSDFITTQKFVLPSVSSAGPDQVTDSASGDIIYATWFFYLDASTALNSSISPDQPRFVTLTARDLRGNKESFSINVARSDFNVPAIAVNKWVIGHPKRPNPVQGDLVGSTVGTSASSISAATISPNATSEIVVSLSNGPFPTATGSGENIVAMQLQDKDNNVIIDQIKPTAVSAGTSATTGSATFSLSSFSFPNQVFSVAADAKMVFQVTSVTGTVGSSNVTGLQYDSKPPTFSATLVEETKAAGDTNTDEWVRPGNDMILTVTMTVDSYEFGGTVTAEDIVNNFSVTGDFKNFVNPVATGGAELVQVTPPANSSTNVYVYTERYTVKTPSAANPVNSANVIVKATDMAGNPTADTTIRRPAPNTSDNYRIENQVPSVNVVRLNAKTDFNKTGLGQESTSFYRVRRAVFNTAMTAPNEGTIVGVGDQIELGVEVAPNDPVFTNEDNYFITANLTQLGGSAAALPSASEQFLGNIFATWTVTVPAGVSSVTNASFPVSVKDPANFAAGGETRNVSIAVDTQVIDPSKITVKVEQYFEGTTNKTSQALSTGLNSAGTGANVANATVVIRAEFEDPTQATALFGTNWVNSRAQTPGRLLNALGGSSSASGLVALEIDPFRGSTLVANGVLAPLDGQGMTGDSNTDTAAITGVGNESGFSVSNISTIGSVSQEQFVLENSTAGPALQNSTSYILEATWSGVPINKLFSSAAKFTLYLTDTIGNTQSFTGFNNVILDGTPPQITFNDLKVVSGSYLPEVKNASGVVIRPTRVKSGAQMNAIFTMNEQPVVSQTSALDTFLSLYEFKTGGQSVAGVTASSSMVTVPFSVGDSSSIPGGEQDVASSLSYTSNGKSTFKTDTGDVKDGDRPYDSAQFYNISSATLANIVLLATDTAGNSNTVRSSFLFEVDNTGPELVESKVFKVQASPGDNSVVASLTNESSVISDFTGTFLQLERNSWLVIAATFVVDGSDDFHFGNITTNAQSTTFKPDSVTRFDPATAQGGSTVLAGAQSATRALRFATYAIQVASQAPPVAPGTFEWTFRDFFGNTTSNSRTVAVDAVGPRANEIAITANGITEGIATDSQVGIGNTGPDLGSTASFELAPGNTLIVRATMSTSNGSAPDTVYADFSELFPPELGTLFDKVLPTSIVLDDDNDLIVATWQNLFYDFSNLVQIGGNVQTSLFGVPNLDTINDRGWTAVGGGALAKNQVIQQATPVSFGEIFTNGFPAAVNISTLTSTLTNLDLPGIVIPSDPLIADEVESLTVTVDVTGDQFAMTNTPSTLFTVDTKRPFQVITLDPAGIIRSLTPKRLFTSAENADRAGYPFAEVLSNESVSVNDIPNRVRGGDVVPFVFEVTSFTINNDDDDLFKSVVDPNNVFDIASSSVDNSVVVMTADVSEFATGQNNVQIAKTADVASYKSELIPDGSGTKVKATVNVTVSGAADGVATTGTGSKRVREVTAIATDDAGNTPVADYFTAVNVLGFNPTSGGRTGNTSANAVKQFEYKPLGVDNRAPTISGELLVRLDSGAATAPNNSLITVGQTVPNNSKIAAGAVLGISATVIDTVDRPLDILNNQAFSTPTLEGVNLADADIRLITETASLIGSDTIDISFQVAMPGVGQGISSKDFGFLISATDTVGNSAVVEALNNFQFDGDPALSLLLNDVLVSGAVTANASATTVLQASAFDVGGVSQITWVAPTVPGVVFNTPSGSFTADFTAGSEFGSHDLLITPSVDASVNGSAQVVAHVTDILGNSKMQTVTVNFNQPPLFADEFVAMTTSSAGDALPSATLTASATGYNPMEGEDTRSIQIEEGQQLVVTVPATDANGDPITFAGGGTALTSTSISSSSLVDNGNGTATFTFNPGFKAVQGSDSATTFVLDASAQDGKIMPDLTKLNVSVLPVAATPTLTIESIKVTSAGGSVQNLAPSTLQVDMLEGSTVQLVVKAEDDGNEALDFLLVQQAQTNQIPSSGIVTSGTSVLYATLTHTPTFTEAPNVITLIMSATNSTTESNKEIRVLNISNVSQPPVVTATTSVGGGAPASIVAGGSVEVGGGQTVNFAFNVNDPDTDPIQTPVVSISDPSGIVATSNAPGSASIVNPDEFNVSFFATLITGATPGTSATVTIRATDTSLPTPRSIEASYTIVVPAGPVPVVAPYDEIVHAQGFGGQTLVNYRNMDPSVDANGDSANNSFDITAHLTSWPAMPDAFNDIVGGGTNRAVFLSKGDVDNDGKEELVTTFGPKTTAATALSSNMFIIREATGIVPLPPFGAVFTDNDAGSIVDYPTGELHTAVGNFIGQATKQIAFAQGTGDNGVLRVLQWNGNTDLSAGSSAWDVVVQLANQDVLDADSGFIMEDSLVTSNEGRGYSIAAGDLDGDGIDELLVGQNGPLGFIQVLDMGAPNAGVGNIVLDASYSPAIDVFTGLEQFFGPFRGDRGVDLEIADLNGDATPEVIITTRGDLGGAASSLTNPVLIARPVLTNGQVTSLAVVGNGITAAFLATENPSNGIRVGTGEFTGFSSDGEELIVGTKAVIDYTGFNATVNQKPPASLYSVLGISFDANGDVTGTSNLIIPGRAEGFGAYAGTFEPASGAVDVIGYDQEMN